MPNVRAAPAAPISPASDSQLLNKALPIVGVVALGAMTWFILSRPSASTNPVDAPVTAASKAGTTPTSTLDPLVLEPEAVAEAPITLDVVRKQGAVGQADRWLSELMATDPSMKPVEGTPNAWKNDRTELRWRTNTAGLVVGAEALFFEASQSADLTALSPYFLGNQDALPVHFEVMTAQEAETIANGTFESQAGTTFFYRAAYRTTGEPPFGPSRFEIQTTPFSE